MIISTYLPEQILSNHDLEKEFPEWSADKIADKLGVCTRHVAGASETALDLAECACRKLFEKVPDARSKVDFLLFCTQSPDYILPGNAHILQHRLGLSTSIGALDYNLGCSGYVYGLALAKGVLSSKIAGNLLLVTAETYTKRINAKDKGNRSIFGDGATATLVTAADAEKIGEFVLGTDGSGFENLLVRNGGTRNPVEVDAAEKLCGSGNIYTDNDIFMDGPAIFNFTIDRIPDLVNQTLAANSLTRDDIKLYIFHQANAYILNFLRKMVRIPADRFYLNMRSTGNTVSNTIPIALDDVSAQGLVKPGDKILLAGFGVGYSYGATVITI